VQEIILQEAPHSLLSGLSGLNGTSGCEYPNRISATGAKTP